MAYDWICFVVRKVTMHFLGVAWMNSGSLGSKKGASFA